MKTKHFFYTFPNNKIIINVNTGSVNGRDWDVIDLPHNQSACWESTAHPGKGFNRGDVEKIPKENKREENNIYCIIHT